MVPLSQNSVTPAFYLYGNDSEFHQAVAQILTQKGLTVHSQADPGHQSFSSHHLVAWIVTDLLNYGDKLLQIISQTTFQPGKLFLIFPLDKTQSSPAKAESDINKIAGYINKYHQLCRQKQIDLRCIGHHGLFYSTGVGEGTSLASLQQLIASGHRPESVSPHLYPFSLPSALDTIVRLWFDRGHKGHTIALLGPELASDRADRFFSSIQPSLTPHPFAQFWASPAAIAPDDTLEIASDLAPLIQSVRPALKPKKLSLPPTPPPPPPSRPEPPPAAPSRSLLAPPPAPRFAFKLPRYLLITVISSLLAYFLVTYGLLFLTLAQVRRFNPGAGESLTDFEQRLDQGLSRYRKLAILSPLDSYFSAQAADAHKLLLTRQLNQLATDSLSVFLGAKTGSFHQQLSQIKVLLDQLYSLATKTQSSPEMIAQLTQFRDLVQLLPQLFPETQKITALILLQNNLELRPTGGFIGAVALATIDHGQLLTLETRDIYDLDSNLRGQVAPPAEVTRYLSETSWYFRDSNWDPDFAQAAASANWFLGKEWGSQADLVIGLNLNSFLPLLQAIGGLNLPDGSSLNSDNLLITGLNYQDTAATAADRPEYLSTILKPLVQRLTQEPDSAIKLRALTGLFQSYRSGEVTLASINSRLTPALDDLHLSGSIYQPLCDNSLAQPCSADRFYLAEANVGINKANYYLTRRTTHQITLTSDTISHRHDLSLTNTSPNDTWPAGPYKVYLRAYLPSTATNIQIFHDGVLLPAGDIASSLVTASRVVGWFVTVNPQVSSQISLTYDLPRPAGLASYQFFLQKQPGLLPGQLEYRLQTPAQTLSDTTDFNQSLFLSLPLVP